MKLPLAIAAPLLTSLGAVRPIRRITMNHAAIVYKTLVVGRTYVVQEGWVRLMHSEGNGRTNFWNLIGTGGMFGDLPFALTASRPTERLEHAVASGSTYLLEFSRAALEREMQRNHEFNLVFMRAYGAFLRFGERRLQWQFTNPLTRRAALVLTDLLRFGTGPCPHGRGYVIPIRLTQEEFAELLDVARQTLNSLMKEWKEQEIISYTRSCLCIRNVEVLQRMAS